MESNENVLVDIFTLYIFSLNIMSGDNVYLRIIFIRRKKK